MNEKALALATPIPVTPAPEPGSIHRPGWAFGSCHSAPSRNRPEAGLAAAKAIGKELGRQPGERPKSDRLAPKVITLITEDRSYRWIARDLGISKNIVADIVRRNRQTVERQGQNMIETERLILRHWRDDHFEAFADMHTDPVVMTDLGGPITKSESKKKFERYRKAEIEFGIARWAVENRSGLFLGYAGVMPRMATDHPLGPHREVGWRLKRSAWGNGYATESAKAALIHAINELGLVEIVSYTSPDNLPSQAVMTRIGLVRSPSLDFVMPIEEDKEWHGLVWVMP